MEERNNVASPSYNTRSRTSTKRQIPQETYESLKQTLEPIHRPKLKKFTKIEPTKNDSLEPFSKILENLPLPTHISPRRTIKHDNTIHSNQQFPMTDKDGHYIVRVGQSLDKIERILGSVIKNIQRYIDASKIEIKILQLLSQKDVLGEKRCIHLDSWFDYHGHICMVFPLLDISLFDYMKLKKFVPFSVLDTRNIIKQVLEAVEFMHHNRIIHTDLKPENVMLVDSKNKTHPLEIKLIDFGSGVFSTKPHSTIVSTRHYRAPEVILGLDWSTPIDIWSIGCMFIELNKAKVLFQTHDDLEHLALISRAIQEFPQHLIKKCENKTHPYFIDAGGFHTLAYPGIDTSIESIAFVQRSKTVEAIIGTHSMERRILMDLVYGMLAIDPSTRKTARQSLDHLFFSIEIE